MRQNAPLWLGANKAGGEFSEVKVQEKGAQRNFERLRSDYDPKCTKFEFLLPEKNLQKELHKKYSDETHIISRKISNIRKKISPGFLWKVPHKKIH